MKLVEAQVRRFRSVIDSTPVTIHPQLTCLVGKNESGKTTFLEALYRLHPADIDSPRFDVVEEYPRWRRRTDENTDGNLEDIQPVRGVFELEDADLIYLQEELGFPVPGPVSVELSRSYKGKLYIRVLLNHAACVTAILDQVDLDDMSRGRLAASQTLDAFRDAVAAMRTELDSTSDEEGDVEGEGDDDSTGTLEALSTIEQLADEMVGADGVHLTLWNLLRSRCPTFFYFPVFAKLPGRVDLRNLAASDPASLDPDTRTAWSLLRLSGVTPQEIMQDGYESRRAELEASAAEITQEVFEYWRQNTHLRVTFDVESETEASPRGQTVVHRYLQTRIYDGRHFMTTNFDVRSSGFQWFFSFIAAFDEYRRKENIIVLLDEPGLGLHGRAQDDFLRFIDERLVPHHQVMYTTHSPFMVRVGHLDQVRVVEDQPDINVGATVSSNISSSDPDTLFPLQAALGYDIAQSLFISPHNLVVEGPSDLLYLSAMSSHLGTIGRTVLDPRWTIVPVGGADKVPTFVALLGNHLDVTVLIDAKPGGNQRLASLVSQGMLPESRSLTVGVAIQPPATSADIEDLFTPGEYLAIFNAAFGTAIKVSQLTGSDPLVRRVTRCQGADFDHFQPARALLQMKPSFFSGLSSGTIDRFERLFAAVNETINK